MKDIDVPETKTDDNEETKADPIEASSETTTSTEDSDNSGVVVAATTPSPTGPTDKTW